jgi:hypothetical protein
VDNIHLTTLAHFYAVFIVFAMAFVALDQHLLISIRIRSILEIWRLLEKTEGFFCNSCREFHWHANIMAFPLDVLRMYRDVHRSRI